MSRNKRNLLIGIATLALVLVIGFVIYFSVANRKTRIYAISYDGLYELELGKVEVRALSVEEFSGNAHIVMNDWEEFFRNDIADGRWSVKYYENVHRGISEDCYILYGDGYYFVSYTADLTSQIIVDNMVATIYTGTEYYFQFPDFDGHYMYGSDGSLLYEPDFYAWDDLVGYNSFEELIGFYGRVNEGYCVVDEENGIIRLNGSSRRKHEMTEGYPIVLTCTDEGVAIGWEEEGT